MSREEQSGITVEIAGRATTRERRIALPGEQDC